MSLFGTLAYFSKGNGWNSVSLQPNGSFPLIFVAMIFIYRIKLNAFVMA